MCRLFIAFVMVLAVTGAAIAKGPTLPEMQESVSNLQLRMDNIAAAIAGGNSPTPATINKLAVLRSEIEVLCDRIVEFGTNVEEPQSQRAVTDLLADIEIVLAENDRLVYLVEARSPAVASLDDQIDIPVVLPTAESLTEPINTPLLDLDLFGFVAGSGAVTNFDTEDDVGVDQAKVTVRRSADDPLVVLAEVEYVDAGEGEFDFDFEQLYASYTIGKGHQITLSLGKFNSPLGWEAVDMPEMYQYSYANVSNCIPSNLAGLMIDVQLAPALCLSSFVVNGWNINGDINRGKTVGGRLGITPSDKADLGLGIITGPELEGNVSSKRTSVDIDYTLSPSARWLVGGEIQIGRESKVLEGDVAAHWRGGLLTNRFTLASDIGLTLRYDYFDDREGYQTGTKQKIHSFTVSPNFEPMTGLRLLLEGKYSRSNAGGFIDSNGQPTDKDLSFAFACSYSL